MNIQLIDFLKNEWNNQNSVTNKYLDQILYSCIRLDVTLALIISCIKKAQVTKKNNTKISMEIYENELKALIDQLLPNGKYEYYQGLINESPIKELAFKNLSHECYSPIKKISLLKNFKGVHNRQKAIQRLYYLLSQSLLDVLNDSEELINTFKIYHHIYLLNHDKNPYDIFTRNEHLIPKELFKGLEIKKSSKKLTNEEIFKMLDRIPTYNYYLKDYIETFTDQDEIIQEIDNIHKKLIPNIDELNIPNNLKDLILLNLEAAEELCLTIDENRKNEIHMPALNRYIKANKLNKCTDQILEQIKTQGYSDKIKKEINKILITLSYQLSILSVVNSNLDEDIANIIETQLRKIQKDCNLDSVDPNLSFLIDAYIFRYMHAYKSNGSELLTWDFNKGYQLMNNFIRKNPNDAAVNFFYIDILNTLKKYNEILDIVKNNFTLDQICTMENYHYFSAINLLVNYSNNNEFTNDYLTPDLIKKYQELYQVYNFLYFDNFMHCYTFTEMHNEYDILVAVKFIVDLYNKGSFEQLYNLPMSKVHELLTESKNQNSDFLKIAKNNNFLSLLKAISSGLFVVPAEVNSSLSFEENYNLIKRNSMYYSYVTAVEYISLLVSTHSEIYDIFSNPNFVKEYEKVIPTPLYSLDIYDNLPEVGDIFDHTVKIATEEEMNDNGNYFVLDPATGQLVPESLLDDDLEFSIEDIKAIIGDSVNITEENIDEILSQHQEEIMHHLIAKQIAQHKFDNPFKKNNPITKKQSKVGRNDPCPCGSGLKYKKCCLLKGK